MVREALTSILVVMASAAVVDEAAAAGNSHAAEAAAPQGVDVERGRRVWKKSKCAFCHGWAGDGHGHPRSPGAAASLRTSKLDRTAMKEIIRCGLPGGAMPYHDRMAYRDGRCFNATAAELKPDEMPNKGVAIQEKDLDSLVAYIFSNIKDRGPVTLEECENYFKAGSRNCLRYR